MKIIKQTEDQLITKDGDLKRIVIGIIFAFMGILVIYFLLHPTYAPGTQPNGSPIVGWIVGIFFAVFGFLMVFLSFSIVVDFNKTTGQMIYKQKKLIGGKATTYNIADIVRIESRKGWREVSPSNNRGGMSVSVLQQVPLFQSLLILKDGLELPLDQQWSPRNSSGIFGAAIMMSGLNTESSLATKIATFLNVPFQEINPPTPEIDINTGSGDVIKF